MGHFKLKNAENIASALDKAPILSCEDTLDGWLLSTSTTVFSSVSVGQPLPLPSLKKIVISPEMATQAAPSFSFEENMSWTSSDPSDASMTDASTCWSSPDLGPEEFSPSEPEPLEFAFWSSEEENQHSNVCAPSSLYEAQKSYSENTPHDRTLTTINFSKGIMSNNPKVFRRTVAVRSTNRQQRSLPHNVYTPFPTIDPSSTTTIAPAHTSWPRRSDSATPSNNLPQRPTLGERAFTSFSRQHPPLPCNLSAYRTPDHHSPTQSTFSTASAPYPHSAPISPSYAPPLMNLMEKSYFEDDSDEEEKPRTVFTRRTFRSASAQSNHTDDEKRGRLLRHSKSRRNLKIAGDAIKGVFGIRKSSVSGEVTEW